MKLILRDSISLEYKFMYKFEFSEDFERNFE